MHRSEPISRHPARTTPAVLLLSVLLGLGGASCGQRGPLYLPEAKAEAAAPAATNPPAEQAPAERAGQDAPPASPDRDEEDDEETP